MGKYVAKKALAGVIAVLFSLALNFTIMRLAPGSPIQIMAGVDTPNPDMIASLTEKYALNKPIAVQFYMYLSNILHGDFGYSYRSRLPVFTLIAQRVGPTFMITFTAAVVSLLLGVSFGLLSARKRETLADRVLTGVSYLFDSMPGFWLALMLVLLFASRLKWFPTVGMVNLRAGHTGFRYMLDVLYHLCLPVFCMTLLTFPSYFRITRASILQGMNEEYVVLFRAAGMSERRIFRKFVLKNAILPTITVFGLSLAYSFTGTSLIEIIFAWPGMGRLLLDGIFNREYMLLSGIYFILSATIATVTVLLDIFCAYLDPRIRLR
jgi:peptide/nickel transport system permease protein